MITFLKLGKFGRFGNQLFQYAALRSLGLKKNCEIGLLNLENFSHPNQKNLLKHLSIFLVKQNSIIKLYKKNLY